MAGLVRDGNGVFDHERLWAAIDAVAAINGLSPSALARRSGLNSTSFNKSKRKGKDGRLRWPSTESIAKMLEATELGLDTFLALLATPPDGRPQPRGDIPLPELELGQISGFSEDAPAGPDATWPMAPDRTLFAIAVADESMLPIYRRGDRLILSRTAQVRRGDRVLIAPVEGGVMARVFCRRTARLLEVGDMTDVSRISSHPVKTILWQARILWASQ